MHSRTDPFYAANVQVEEYVQRSIILNNLIRTVDNYDASLFSLKEIKDRQEVVNRGYQLLKRKADALRIKGRQAASELAKTQGALGQTLKEAFITLAAIKFTNGESNALVLENIGEAQIRVQRTAENISGVNTVSLEAIEDMTASDALCYAGLASGGHRTQEAKIVFREAVRILVKFASLRNMCILLDAAIKTTVRKVNGIEKVILPKLKNTEAYIAMEMDEMEREEFHRLKMMKAKKVRARVLATLGAAKHLKTDQGKCGSGESENALNIKKASQILSLERFSGLPYARLLEPVGDCVQSNIFWEDEDLLF